MKDNDGYILLTDANPVRFMKVEWITKDGTWDCGWFNGRHFISIDPHIDKIIKWRPFVGMLHSQKVNS